MLIFALLFLLPSSRPSHVFVAPSSRLSGETTIQQTAEIPKGRISEKLVCANHPEQSYALYLPSNYSSARKWPVLYAFDPGARGELPVERYQEAAEKYGWIVAGLNNSRNGSMQQSADAFAAVWDDTQRRFAIDERRAYTTGFSGGARAATFLAARCDCVAGVIGSGAGFPMGMAPFSAIHFVYFGTVGMEDFNFPEMKNLDGPLAKAAVIHWLEVFSGRHEWPPLSVAIKALEWMELESMKAGRRPRDNDLADAIWQKYIREARALKASSEIYSAYLKYLWLDETFKGLRDVTDLERELDQLRNNRVVRDAIHDEQQQIRKQQELESRIRGFIAARQRKESNSSERENTGDGGFDDAVHLEGALAELRKSTKATADSSDRRVARRVLEGLLVGLFEQGLKLLQTQKDYDDAVQTFKLAVEVNPDRAGPFFYLAWAYAGKGDRKKSLQALKTAIEKGFSDLGTITHSSAFDSIRNDPEYQQIILPLKKGN